MPPEPSLIGTFLICGLFHDLVTFLVRGHTAFLFAAWFLLMGFMVLFTRILNHDFSNRPWLFRAGINLFIVGGCYFLATRGTGYLTLALGL